MYFVSLRKFTWICAVLITSMGLLPVYVCADDWRAQQDRAVLLARDGATAAAQEWLHALATTSESASVLNDWFVVAVWNDDYARAMQIAPHLEPAGNLPDYVLKELAFLYRQTEQTEKAIGVYRTWLQRQPSAERLDPLLTLLIEHDKHQLNAVVEANRALIESSPPLRIKLARAASDSENWEQVFDWLNASALREPHFDAAKPVLIQAHTAAVTLARKGQFEQALELLQRLEALGYTHEKLDWDLIAVHEWHGAHEEALRLFRLLPPNSAPAYVLQAAADAALHLEELPYAAAIYAELLEKEPENSNALEALVRLNMALNNHDEALALTERLLRLHPSEDLEFTRAELLLRTEQYDAAYASLSRAARESENANRVYGLLLELPDAFWDDWHNAHPSRPPEHALDGAAEIFGLIRHLELNVPEQSAHVRYIDDTIAGIENLPKSYRIAPFIRLGALLLKSSDFPAAEALYRRVLTLDADNRDARLGLAKIDLARGNTAESIRALSALIDETDWIDARFVRAESYEQEEEFLKAVADYNRILEMQPGYQAAIDLKARNLMSLGTAGLVETSLRGASEYEHIDPVIRERIQGDRIMYAIRWGESQRALQEIRETRPSPQAPEDSAARLTQRKLTELRSRQRTIEAELMRAEREQEEPSYALRSEWDRIQALRHTHQMEEAVLSYDRLLRAGHAPSPDIKQAVGDAYLYLKLPDFAVELYEQVLEERPHSLEAQMALYYAYIDRNDLKKAAALLENMIHDQSDYILSRGMRRENWQKAYLSIDRAWLMMYSDRFAEAERVIQDLEHRAPFNTHILNAKAHLHYLRGWTRRAKEDFEIVQTLSPDLIGAANGYSLVLYDLGEKKTARELNTQLLEKHPANLHLQRTKRAFKVREMTLLQLDASITTEHPGVEEYRISLLGEEPVNDWARVFAQLTRIETAESGPNEIRRRGYVGAELRRYPWMTLRAAVAADYESGDDAGWLARLTLTPDDHWTLSAGYDSHTLDIPIRSRTPGIKGELFDIGLTWRASERFDTTLGSSWRRLSDGNDTLGLSWRTDSLVYPGIGWNFRTATEVYWSHNADTNVAYYSPEYAAGFFIVPRLEHTLYRRYDNAWVHRLYVGLGEVWQKNFAAHFSWFVRYEHDLAITDLWTWLIGTTYAQRIYDGEDVNTLTLYTTLRLRF